MNNETGNEKKTLLVLVPHRDARLQAQEHRDTLLKTGISGVYPFPCIAPLASISKPLTENELKNAAFFLRNVFGTEMINVKELSSAEFPQAEEKMTLFGLRLELKFPSDGFMNITKKMLNLLSPIVIGSFLTSFSYKNSKENYKQDDNEFMFKNSTPAPPKISFRAAALANMYWQPIVTENETAYKWKIGKLCWLPKKTKP
ncbi:MAG: hypothetical protein FWB89_01860 [Treponema sp.]|nr:hypothetical protein [Treponema sp.]